ncbi:hypothetical protein ROZALSC1DRAFT_26037, partial [Rozella allomycis CSF55]
KANVFTQDQNNEYFYNTFNPSKWYCPIRVTGLKEYFVHSEFPALTFARFADVVIDQLTEQDFIILEDPFNFISEYDYYDVMVSTGFDFTKPFLHHLKGGCECECSENNAEYDMSEEAIKRKVEEMRKQTIFNFCNYDSERTCVCFREFVDTADCSCGYVKHRLAIAIDYLNVLYVERQQIRYCDIFEGALTTKNYEMLEFCMNHIKFDLIQHSW